MVKQQLNEIFLSASIPLPERNHDFYEDSDMIAIRDAVKALTTIVIPHSKLIWGGHPSITPLIRYVMGRMNLDLQEHVTLYQSAYFQHLFPKDNKAFENIVITEKRETREESLNLMRERMLGDHNFRAGIFIGGMEGVIQEYELFREMNPKAIILPIASTGAAAKMIYNYSAEKNDLRLKKDFAYLSLFKDLLKDITSNE